MYLDTHNIYRYTFHTYKDTGHHYVLKGPLQRTGNQDTLRLIKVSRNFSPDCWLKVSMSQSAPLSSTFVAKYLFGG